MRFGGLVLASRQVRAATTEMGIDFFHGDGHGCKDQFHLLFARHLWDLAKLFGYDVDYLLLLLLRLGYNKAVAGGEFL